MNWKNSSCVILFFIIASVFVTEIFAQIERPRLVQTTSSSRPTTSQAQNPSTIQRPISLVKKIVSSTPTNVIQNSYLNNLSFSFGQKLRQAMDLRLGIRYRYGSTGPNTYDCSGLIWSVFQDAGLYFERSSANTYWREFEPVFGDERFKFGTLVFFNDLGHVGIVVDDKGFYHASSSKGVTYSPFAGYWEKRVVGFRRIPTKAN